MVLVHVLFRTLRSVSVETANLVLALESPDRRDAALPKTTKREGSCRCSIQRQCALFYVLWFGWNTGKDNKKEMGETSIIAIRKFVCVCEDVDTIAGGWRVPLLSHRPIMDDVQTFIRP